MEEDQREQECVVSFRWSGMPRGGWWPHEHCESPAGRPGARSYGWAGARGSLEHGKRRGRTGHLLPSSRAGLTGAALAPALPLHQVPLLSGRTNGTRTQRKVGVPWKSLGEAGDGPQEGNGTYGGSCSLSKGNLPFLQVT